MDLAAYWVEGKTLSQQVRADIKRVAEMCSEERLAGAVSILRGIRLWEREKRGFLADKEIVNQASYVQNLVRKHLRVDVEYEQIVGVWNISSRDAGTHYLLFAGDLSISKL